MRKVQFFLLVESIIFTLAFFDVLASQQARSLLFIAFVILGLWYLLGRRQGNILLLTGIYLIFLVFLLNPFFILGIILLIVYIFFNFFSRYQKQNQYTHLVFEDTALAVKRDKNLWFGNQDHHYDQFGYEDINMIRLFGNDVIDLDETVLTGRDNIFVVRKIFGKTKIIVPIDVEVSLSASSIYGSVRFMGQPQLDLRNENVSLSSPNYLQSHKRIKIVVNSILGDVEVVSV
ncbi:hypothetical protein HO675_04585 [Streptococcus suis]|nr:hypothetical protein [Streptococcus suis]